MYGSLVRVLVDSSQVEVRLETGQKYWVPFDRIEFKETKPKLQVDEYGKLRISEQDSADKQLERITPKPRNLFRHDRSLSLLSPSRLSLGPVPVPPRRHTLSRGHLDPLDHSHPVRLVELHTSLDL